MIKKVGFKNFRVLADVEVELEPFTILVGPNASGKSTILDGLNRIARCRSGRIHSLVNGANFKFPNDQGVASSPSSIFTNKLQGELRFSASVPNPHLIVSVGFKQNHISTWEVSVNTGGNKSTWQQYSLQVGSWQKELSWLPMSIHLQLSGEKIAEPSYSPAIVPQMRPTGEGLAVVLTDIALRDEERYKRIQNGLQEIISHVKLVRLERAEVFERNWIDHQLGAVADKKAIGSKIVVDFMSARGIPAEAVSEGTLFALAILTFATDSENDWLILLDDLERGLHPRACGDLVKVLKNLVKEFPRLQIVATTHSPYLLNFVEPEEVRVVTLNSEGHTLVAKLTEHPEYDQWKDSMMPGEFWGWAGEDWVRKTKEVESSK